MSVFATPDDLALAAGQQGLPTVYIDFQAPLPGEAPYWRVFDAQSRDTLATFEAHGFKNTALKEAIAWLDEGYGTGTDFAKVRGFKDVWFPRPVAEFAKAQSLASAMPKGFGAPSPVPAAAPVVSPDRESLTDALTGLGVGPSAIAKVLQTLADHTDEFPVPRATGPTLRKFLLDAALEVEMLSPDP